MSRRDGETSTSKDDASRAHPGRGRFLRGSTWAIGDYTPSKQVNNHFKILPFLVLYRYGTHGSSPVRQSCFEQNYLASGEHGPSINSIFLCTIGVQAEQVPEGALRGSHVRSAMSEFSGKNSAIFLLFIFILIFKQIYNSCTTFLSGKN
jgi:hypothetical protein